MVSNTRRISKRDLTFSSIGNVSAAIYFYHIEYHLPKPITFRRNAINYLYAVRLELLYAEMLERYQGKGKQDVGKGTFTWDRGQNGKCLLATMHTRISS